MGILSLLEEQARLEAGSDERFCNALTSHHAKNPGSAAPDHMWRHMDVLTLKWPSTATIAPVRFAATEDAKTTWRILLEALCRACHVPCCWLHREEPRGRTPCAGRPPPQKRCAVY